jgi:1-acyl-sn-glycerol-3-phosphate acyltransferase
VSHFDPPVLTITCPRKIDWIADVGLFHGKLLCAFFTGLNVIPVDRSGADRTALRTAVKRLKDGRVVGIFPEGGIRDGAKSIVNGAAMKQGMALLATLSGAPILPCVILGSDRFYNAKSWLPWRRPTVWLAFGNLIEHPEGLTGDALRKHMQETFAREILSLTARLRADHALADADLPRSPQERMAEP